MASGTIRTSLFAATDEARLPDSVANQIAEVFSADIDFRRDLRVGDRFSVVYETRAHHDGRAHHHPAADSKEPKLEGPVVDAEGRTDVVANQSEVDDLLASLGF